MAHFNVKIRILGCLVQLSFLLFSCLLSVAQESGLESADSKSEPSRVEWTYENEDRFGQPSAGDGKMFIGDFSGTVHALSADDGRQVWTYNTKNKIMQETVFVNGRVYVANRNKELFCLNAKTGKKFWKFTAEQLKLPEGYKTISPTISRNRVIFGYTGTNYLYCLSTKDGSLLWKKQFPGELGRDVVISGRDVFATTWKRLYRLNIRTGKTKWKKEYKNPQKSAPSAPAVDKTTVYISRGLGEVSAFSRENGQVQWTKKGYISPKKPAIEDGRLYIGTQKNIVCRSADDGSKIWEFQHKSVNKGRGRALDLFSSWGIGGSVSISDGYIYANTSYTGRVFSIKKESGTLRWKLQLGKDLVQDGPIVYRKRLYIPRSVGKSVNKKSWHGIVYCLSTDLPDSANDWPIQAGNPGHTGTPPDQKDEN